MGKILAHTITFIGLGVVAVRAASYVYFGFIRR